MHSDSLERIHGKPVKSYRFLTQIIFMNETEARYMHVILVL